MAVAYVSTTNSGLISAASSVTFAVDVGSGTDRGLVVSVVARDITDQTASTPTYNGDNLTSSGTKANNGLYQAWQWYLANPDSGSNNLVVGFGASSSAFVVRATVMTGFEQTTPLSNYAAVTGSADPFSLALTPPDNDCILIAAALHEANTLAGPPALTSGQTVIDEVDHGNYVSVSAYKIQTSAGAETFTWDVDASNSFAGVIGAYKAAAGGGGGVTPTWLPEYQFTRRPLRRIQRPV